ncbi:DNA topoisomerase IV, alpha subunit [Lindgomyces ingoldianus]|uniref:DNA topoisomerase IV, alpha subunit n=1 Tax=Lindgomyces ingoldianus TaxID=673940 RepID=A0ACB6QP64_9PLEO|nr:DNA topoisomerase IV, alpha subunit [Lindgomyces ingoldianus]KAF2467887.1 DNA topoisomerase IV, alpha subunit [Lindgomyces ingoldianus]
MNSDGVEEMLFGFPSSQDSLDQTWEQTYQDDDLLEAKFDSDPPSWILRTTPTQTSNWVVARIEHMLEEIVDGLLGNRDQLSITLKSRSSAAGRVFEAGKGMVATSESKTREISFPGNTPQEAWRFTVLLRIIELVHSALIDNLIISKRRVFRDIYYRHPDLFVKQSVVDRYVDDLAFTFGVTRSLLNVVAAAKSLVAGHFTIRRADGTTLHGLDEKEGILLPKIRDVDILDLSCVHWILIIEKEATFRSLLSSPEWVDLGSSSLLLTAKGYPDLAARQFLRYLADHFPSIQMSALVDFDPDGLAIMSTYKYGSMRLAHENVATNDTPALALPQLSWLGVRSHQLSRTPVTGRVTNCSANVDAQGLMRLTSRDRKKAHRMLEWEICREDGPEPTWRSELQTMLMLNTKAEMQILEEQPGGLASWVNDAFRVKQKAQGDANRSVPRVASGSDIGFSSVTR